MSRHDVAETLAGACDHPAVIGSHRARSFVEAALLLGEERYRVLLGLSCTHLAIKRALEGWRTFPAIDPASIEAVGIQFVLSKVAVLTPFDESLAQLELLKELQRVPALCERRDSPVEGSVLSLIDLDYRILRSLADQTCSVTLVQLAAAVGSDRSAIGRRLKLMKEAGLAGPPSGRTKRGTVIYAAGGNLLRANRQLN